jgi:hypothetical protein
MASGRINIFISYGRGDSKDLALKLCEDLRSAGYPTWLDVSEIPGGASWSQNIEKAIEECDVLLALMSPHAYQSQWCRAEQLRAIRKGKRVIPLMAVVGAEPPLHLEHLNYLDFTQPPVYDERFSDLLSDIRAGMAFLQPHAAPKEATAPVARRSPRYKASARATLAGGKRPQKRSASSFRRILQELREEDWLGARFWWTSFLFYFTDIHSFVNILKHDELLSAHSRGDGMDTKWDRFVRLYFRPRTPDLFHAEGFRPGIANLKGYAPVPVYLLFDIETLITHPDAQFSYGDPVKTRNVYRTPNLFREMPFEQIYHDSWMPQDEKEEIMRCREAQVLIPDKLGLESLQVIWTRSEAEYDTLHQLLPPELWRKWRDKITARTDYHLFNHKRAYIHTAALQADHIALRFNPPDRDTGTFVATANVTYPDGTQFKWQDEDFQTENLTIALPNGKGGYRVEVTLDGDLAYSGTHKGDNEVV